MEYEAAQVELKALAARLRYALLISIGLLISNIFLVWLVGWALAHQKIMVIPTETTQSFVISESSIDASYLRQMALFFIAHRLDITPTNVEQSHSLILQYTDPKFYHEFIDILAKEKQAVIKQNISSVFYPEEVIPNCKELSVTIKGLLAHWVGNTSLAPVKKNYIIKFSYRSGNLKVNSFIEGAIAS
jgi:conjugal transfer pilus assembly protein TraE